jgi:hypothetical protein
METAYDPYDMFFGDGQNSPSSEALLFPNEVMLSDFNVDSSSISPISNTIDNTGITIQQFLSSSSIIFFVNLESDFDPAVFEKLLNELLSSDPSTLQEQSFNLSFASTECEPSTREIGTDPMEPTPTALPLIIKTHNINQQSTTSPIFLIQTLNKIPAVSAPNEYYNLQIESSTTNDYQMEDSLPLTPSTSDSPDESRSHSPEFIQNC